MGKTLFALIFVLTYNLAQAQTQPQFPISPMLELPKDYQTWQGESETLTLRKNLIAKKEGWSLNDPANPTKEMKGLMLMRLNNEIVFTVMLEGHSAPKPTDPEYIEVRITLNWLVDGGYITLSGNAAQPGIELEEKTDLAWKMWDGFMRYKFNINDKEMEQLDRFFPL